MSSESAAAWSSVAAGWERRDAWLSSGMRPVTERLLERLEARPGDTVLDVGCGTGEVGRLAAVRVEPEGRVLLTDHSAEMVEIARRLGEGLANLEARAMDAERLDLPDASVDRVVSRFAFMLVPEPPLAFAEAHRVLRPGGRLAFAVWTSGLENPWGSTTGRALLELGLAEPPEPDTPGPFRLADPDRLRSLVADAGFAEPTIDAVEITMRYASLDEYWAVTADLSMTLRDTLARLSSADTDELRARLGAALARYEDADGLTLPGRAWVVAADR